MRVLIIEDDKKVASFLLRGLTEQGYSVETVHTGEEGLERLQTGKCDIALLDVLLPGKDGFAILHEARTIGVNTPVLVLTARDSLDDRITGLDLRGDDYLVKPFEFPELLARIRALLRRGKPERSNVLQCCELTLNLVKREIRRNGKCIEVTQKEFALLEYLMRNQGYVLSRTMILNHVWNIDYDNFSNVVDVHINALRNKIEKGFEHHFIHTVRGLGYVLKGGEGD